MGINALAGVGAAAAVWFFFNFTTMAVDYLYMSFTPNLVIINMGYQLVSYLVAGAILGLMPGRAKAAKVGSRRWRPGRTCGPESRHHESQSWPVSCRSTLSHVEPPLT